MNAYIFSINYIGSALILLWYINHCRLFNAKSCLSIYIEYTWFVKTFGW